MTTKCCTKCYRSREATSVLNPFGRVIYDCKDKVCPCHTQEDWRERFDELMTYVSDGAPTEPFPKFPVYPGYESLKAFIETEIQKAKGEVLEDYSKWLFENGITHKQCFVKVRDYLSSQIQKEPKQLIK